MKINPISLNSFKAKLVRDPKPGDNTKSSSKEEMVQSYNKAIQTIQKQKAVAIEFDTFMRTPEVKEIVENLPKEDRLIMDTKYYAEVTGYGELARSTMGLTYESDDPFVNAAFEQLSSEERAEVSGLVDVQNPDGSLNKKGITDYLKRLKDFMDNQV